MPREKTDLTLLHKMLWKRSDRLGRLPLVQAELAEELRMSKYHLNRFFKEMERNGWIKKLEGHRGNTWTYLIRDPDQF